MRGRFGKVRVIERIDDGARYYMTGGSAQTLIDAEGTSLFGYVNALKLLLRRCPRVLMIGGGGGSLASMLARKGHVVTVVDVDPLSAKLAREFFDLHPKVNWHTGNGLTYVADKTAEFDAVVVDACTSRGTVAAFIDVKWIERAMRALTPNGVLMINLVHDVDRDCNSTQLADQIADKGLHVILLCPETGWEGNELLLVTRADLDTSMGKEDILARPAEARSYLMSLRRYHAHDRQYVD